MTPILTDNQRKAALSFSYLAAISAKCGYTCEKGPSDDMDSIDALIKAGGNMRPQIDVQLKATSSLNIKNDGAHFSLSRKNYDDLRMERMVPIILAVYEMPTDEFAWCEVQSDKLILKKKMLWLSLFGQPDITTDTKTVVIPNHQVLTPDSLGTLMQNARGGSV